MGEHGEVLVDFDVKAVVPIVTAFTGVSLLGVVRDLKSFNVSITNRIAEIAAKVAETAGEDLLVGMGHYVVGHACPLRGHLEKNRYLEFEGGKAQLAVDVLHVLVVGGYMSSACVAEEGIEDPLACQLQLLHERCLLRRLLTG